jgi:hypothetical protein
VSNTYQILRSTRDAVILNLRRIFSGDPTYKYRYVELSSGEYDWDSTRLIISDIIPQEHAFFPAIVVDTVSGPETRYLGPDDLRETRDPITHEVIEEKLFSSLDLTVNINVYTINDTIARDEIVDRIYDHLKLITDDLADNGIEIKRVSFSPETRAFVDDRWYITARIVLEIYKEWSDDIAIGDLVGSIPITISLNP